MTSSERKQREQEAMLIISLVFFVVLYAGLYPILSNTLGVRLDALADWPPPMPESQQGLDGVLIRLLPGQIQKPVWLRIAVPGITGMIAAGLTLAGIQILTRRHE